MVQRLSFGSFWSQSVELREEPEKCANGGEKCKREYHTESQPQSEKQEYVKLEIFQNVESLKRDEPSRDSAV